MFIGYVLAMALYGIASLQVFLYFYKHRNVSGGMKPMVFALWILDNLHIALTSHAVYKSTVSFHGNPMKATHPIWTIAAQIYITVIIHFLIRGVYSYRIWRLSQGNIILPVVITALSAIVVVMGCTFASKALTLQSWRDTESFSWSIYIAFGTEIAADTITAIAMFILLVRMRTGLKSSDSLVQTMIMYSINTGILTIICVLLILITVVYRPP